MTEKEKAKELLYFFLSICSDIGSFRSSHVNIEAAKECASKCVYEVIKAFPEFDIITDLEIDFKKYWDKVKVEIMYYEITDDLVA